MNRIEIIMKIKELEKMLLTLESEDARWAVINRLIGLETVLTYYDGRLTN